MSGYVVFSKEWCSSWKDVVSKSDDFAKFNKGWHGDISGIIFADPERRVPEEQYLYLDFEDGVVNNICMTTKEKAEAAEYVIRGDYVRWKQVAKKEIDAVKAMMQGKLKLTGNLPYVVRYIKGVQEAIRCLTTLTSIYPDEN